MLVLTRRPARDREVRLAMPVVDTAAVDTVALTKGRDTALLVRGPDRQWTVNGLPAAPINVRQLLYALRDTSNRLIAAAQGAAAQAPMGVSADSGQRVRVMAGGRAVLDWTAGHQTDDYAGVYVRPTAGDSIFALHGTLAGAFGHQAAEWRDRTIVALPRARVQRVEVERGGHIYSLIRRPSGWTVGSAATDSAVVGRLLDQLNPLTAQAFATPAEAAAARFDPPTVRVRVLGLGGASLADVRFDSTKAGVWARSGDGPTVFQVGDWVLGALAPAERALRADTPKAR